MRRIHRYYYSPELILIELAILLVITCISHILSIYHRKKKDTSPTWRCTCSRVNPGKEYVCICGRTKLSALTATPPPHQSVVTQSHHPKSWHCTCGRENASYQSSCVCGKNKHELLTTNIDLD